MRAIDKLKFKISFFVSKKQAHILKKENSVVYFPCL